jgi:uncharacterized protein YvpB
MTKALQVFQWTIVGILVCILVVFVLVFGLFVFSREWDTISAYFTLQTAPGQIPSAKALPVLFVGKATLTPFQPVSATPNQTSTLIILPTKTPTITPTPTVTPTFTPTPTETPTPIPTEAPPEPEQISPGDLPAKARIHGIRGQPQSFNLDCEARSAVDLANFFGVQINEIEFLNRLPRSDDPNQGFVGNYWDPRGQLPPKSYGVYASPIASLLKEYGVNAEAVNGMGWDTIRGEVASGRPVMTWVVGDTWSGQAVPYTTSNGNTTMVVRFEHTVLVIGYDESDAIILDGDWLYRRNIASFLDSFGALGNMAVKINP